MVSRETPALLDEVFAGQERLSRDELHRRAVSAGAASQLVEALDRLPAGEYTRDEVVDALVGLAEPPYNPAAGVPAAELGDADLLRELATVHRTRHDTLRHGSEQALLHHDQRMAELEGEYLRRFPRREVDPERLTAGARARHWARPPAGPAGERPRTGADQAWDPEDLAVAEGHDPTPEHVERARRELSEEGPSAVERTVP